MDFINIKNAHEHNLKNIDVKIPRDQLTVITGPSGSGKSSLAFDIIYNEANRKFLEALSLKSRNQFEQIEKPLVDSITGISPAIAIQQKKLISNIRSTVGTATEIYNLLRVLFAHKSIPHCPQCGKPISIFPVDNIITDIKKSEKDSRIFILSPVIRNKKGNYRGLLEKLSKKGFIRFEIDKDIYLYEDIPALDENKEHNISVIIDRFLLKEENFSRIGEDIEAALSLSEGFVIVRINEQDIFYSQQYSCLTCNLHFDIPDLKLFSFNNPKGACPECSGLGKTMIFSPELMINEDLSINEGGIRYFSSMKGTAISSWIKAIADYGGFDFNTPLKKLNKKQKELLFYGKKGVNIQIKYNSKKITGTFNRELEGIITQARRRYKNTPSEEIRKQFESKFMEINTCPSCQGKRLNPFALHCLIEGFSIADFSAMSVKKMKSWINDFLYSKKLSNAEFDKVMVKIISELNEKIESLAQVGLDYITLDRSMPTLSGGEESRIRLASQISSFLTGVTYILDEPTSGLHPKDIVNMLSSINKLIKNKNTVIIVEHDETVIKSAEYIVELGEGAGIHGGSIMIQDKYDSFIKTDTLTAGYLNRRLKILEENDFKNKEIIETGFIKIQGAGENNLKNIDVNIPLKAISVVCGISGSGKSTLVDSILYPVLANKIMHAKKYQGKHNLISGFTSISNVYYVNQSPIGTNARSNPATFIGVFDDIRNLLANLSEAKKKGYKHSRFSFNSKDGRCEKCKGLGTIKVDMHYMPDMYITCDICAGKRYKNETLSIKLKGKNISDILEMTFGEAADFFQNYPHIKSKLDIMNEVGLHYLKLGQPAPTLSGGESQRLKIALELGKSSYGQTLYILDEPTSGLHFYDISNLLKVLKRLADKGNTLVIIEHNLSVISAADYIIELGPGGGDKGGNVVFQGYLSDFKHEKTATTEYLFKNL